MKIRVLLFFLLSSTGVVTAESAQPLGDSVKNYIRKARRCAEVYEFSCAEENYRIALKADQNDRTANGELGMLLSRYMNRRQDAVPYLERALQGASSKDSLPELLFELGRSYHFVSHYEDAKKNYQVLIPMCQDNEAGKELRAKLNRFIENCNYGQQQTSESNEHLIRLVEQAVNSPGPEYVPVFLKKDSTFLFTARRIDNKDGEIDPRDGKFYEDIYISTVSENGYSPAKRVSVEGIPNHLPGHTAIASVSPNGNTLFLVVNGKLFSARYDGSGIKDMKDLGPNINFSDYQNHASITEDGKTLYFSSRSNKGYGGLDIYRSQLQNDGSWGPSENLGPEVNTPDDEESPAISFDGTRLYFSSRGLPGFGGYDLFSADLQNGKFTNVKNLGAPVNSPADDTYLVLDPGGRKGYFTSDRSSGMGDLDIYKLILPVNPEDLLCERRKEFYIQGDTLYKVNEEVRLDIQFSENVFNDVIWRVDGQVLEKEKANHILISFKDGKDHAVEVEAIITLVNDELTKICDRHNLKPYPELIAVEGKTKPIDDIKGEKENELLKTDKGQLSSVYFDFDRSTLPSDAKQVLDENLKIIADNPNAKITLRGYADSRGDAAYNLALSKRRLNAVINYLVSKGFAKSRIAIAEAKGESDLVNGCDDTSECTEDEHQKNRRVSISWF